MQSLESFLINQPENFFAKVVDTGRKTAEIGALIVTTGLAAIGCIDTDEGKQGEIPVDEMASMETVMQLTGTFNQDEPQSSNTTINTTTESEATISTSPSTEPSGSATFTSQPQPEKIQKHGSRLYSTEVVDPWATNRKPQKTGSANQLVNPWDDKYKTHKKK